MTRGKFIVLEGTDGAGKSEQMSRLITGLQEAGHPATVTREPGGTEAGEKIRAIIKDTTCSNPVAEMFLFQAARAELVASVIKPALESGQHVLSDRFAASTIAYQGYGSGVDLDQIRAATEIAINGLKPDLTIWLDIKPEQARERTRARGSSPDAIENRGQDFHQAVRRGYADQRDTTWLHVDASAHPDTIQRTIWSAVLSIIQPTPKDDA